MSGTPTQAPPTGAPLAALLAGAGAPRPAELLLGPLNGPARLPVADDGAGAPGRGLAVLFWRGGVHVLAYDRADGGCPQCLCWFLTRQVTPRPTAPYGEPAPGGESAPYSEPTPGGDPARYREPAPDAAARPPAPRSEPAPDATAQPPAPRSEPAPDTTTRPADPRSEPAPDTARPADPRSEDGQAASPPTAPHNEPAPNTAPASHAAARAEALWRGLGPALQGVVVRLAARLLRDGHPAGALATVDRASGAVQSGQVPPRAGCPGCLPSAATTEVAFGAVPELLVKAEGTLRGRRPLPPTLVSDYVAPHALFREPLVDLDGPVPAAQVGLPLGNGDLEPGIGRSPSFTASRRTAVLEGLERYTGFHFRPTEGIVEASLADLGARAVDPLTLGYHAEESYAREDFPFAPLGKDEVVRWVPVTPLGDGPARHLPEPALTWVRPPGARKPFFYDTSNGFALGQSPEEATLHGILEIVERDAFLLTWYRRLLLPELRLGPADRELRDLLERVEIVTGFRVRLFWAALDTGIPVVLALAQRASASGPCTFVSTGAGLHPRAAAESAVFEVAAILSAVVHSFEENRERALRLAEDFRLVRTMADHSLLGALPTSREWFDFLDTPDRPELSLAEATAASPVAATLDGDLDEVRARIEAVGAHVYVADVTTPELRWRGLECTRTFVPGFLPMTFGHDTRRLVGLPRLDDARLPYESLLPPGRTPADLPPHPFP